MQRCWSPRGRSARRDGLSRHSGDEVSHLAVYESTFGLSAKAAPNWISVSGSARRPALPSRGT